jgi:site-specific recombinase XerD
VVAMPRKLPPFLHRETSRHGRAIWYFRRGKATRVRLPDEFGSVEFWSAYEAAANGARPQRQGHAQGTFAWALAVYRQSQAWTALSPATQRQRINIFKHVEKKLGDSKLRDWKRGDIVAGRDARAKTPAQAVNFIKALRPFFAWALEAGHVAINPCDGVKVVSVATEGFAVWTDEDVSAYRARWPLGTYQRVAFEVLHETGLRRGDAVLVGAGHVRDGVIRILTEKTGERVSIAMSDTLASAVAAGPTGALTFIVGAGGKPLVKESFTNMFREWALAAKVNKSAHGVRKAAATADAMDGYNDAELGAKYGWTGRKMPALYTRSANRERLSLAAAERVKARTKVPHLGQKVRGQTQEKSGDSESIGAQERTRTFTVCTAGT